MSSAQAAIEPDPANDRYETAWELVGNSGQLQQDYTVVYPGSDTVTYRVNQAEGLWYRWTAPADGRIHCSSEDSAFEPTLTVMTGDSAEHLVEWSFNRSQVFCAVETGANYYLRASRVQQAAGILNLNWEFVERPVITAAPESLVRGMGDAAAFSVEASGVPPLQYQWYQNDKLIPGATAAELNLAAVGLESVGRYRVRVHNRGGYIDSAEAVLSGPELGPTILAQPNSVEVSVGESVQLSIEAEGSGAVAYQWRKHGFAIENGTAATLILPDANLDDAGFYDVLVTDEFGEQRSRRVRVSVFATAASDRLEVDPSWKLELDREKAEVTAVTPLADGGFAIAGSFRRINGHFSPNVAKLHGDGGVDESFTSNVVLNGPVNHLLAMPGGDLLVVGDFRYRWNEEQRFSIARIAPDGDLVKDYRPIRNFSSSKSALKVDQEGGLIVAGYYDTSREDGWSSVARLNPDGTRDETFAPVIPESAQVGYDCPLAVDLDGTIYVGGESAIWVLDSSGFVLPDRTIDLSGWGKPMVLALDREGGIVVANGSLNDLTQWRHYGADGELIEESAGRSGPFYGVDGMGLDQAGRLWISGRSASDRNRGAVGVVVDGVTSAAYALSNGVVSGFALDSVGRPLVVGEFIGAGEIERQGVVRFGTDLLPDAAVDFQFKSRAKIADIVLQADGRVVVAGDFTEVNGDTAPYLARVNADGSLDVGFAPAGATNSPISRLTEQADGKLLIAGDFSDYGGVAINRVARVDSDGSIDESFLPPEAPLGMNVLFLTPLTGGGCALGGGYSGSGPHRIRILDSDGSIRGYGPEQFYGHVANGVEQQDGQLVFGGSNFTFADHVDLEGASLGRLNDVGALDPFYPAGRQYQSYIMGLAADVRDRIWLLDHQLSRGSADGRPDLALSAPAELAFGSADFRTRWLAQSGGRMLFGGDFGFRAEGGGTASYFVRFENDGRVDEGFSVRGLMAGVEAMAQRNDGQFYLSSNGELLRTRVASLITEEPIDVVARIGDDATFTVDANGDGLTYQWRRNGVAILGATDSTLTLAAVGFDDADRYDVVVADDTGASVVSDAALLYVFPATLPGQVTPDLDWNVELRGGLSGFTRAIAAPNGGALLVGKFIEVDGHATWNLAKIEGNGEVDTNFAAPSWGDYTLDYEGAYPHWQGEKIIVAAEAKPFGGATGPALFRLNSNGTLDSSFAFAPAVLPQLEYATITDFQLDSVGRIYVRYSVWNPLTQTPLYGVVRLLPDGQIDEGFGTVALGGTVWGFVVRADGRMLVWGRQLTLNGATLGNMIQLSADGTYLPSFNPPAEFDPYLGDAETRVLAHPVEGLTVYVRTISPDHSAYPHLMRWSDTGEVIQVWDLSELEVLDDTYSFIGPNAGVRDLYEMVLRPEGGVLFVGRSYDSRRGSFAIMAQALPTGELQALVAGESKDWRPAALDLGVNSNTLWITSFGAGSAPILSQTNPPALIQSYDLENGELLDPHNLSTVGHGIANDILPLTDGSWLVGGDFDEVDGSPSQSLVRINGNGDVVGTFTSETGGNGPVNRLVWADADTILIEGGFSQFAGEPANRLVKVSSTFDPIPGFQLDEELSETARISFPLPGGELLTSSWWLSSSSFGQPSRRIAIIDADGVIDDVASFKSLDGPMYGATVLPDGSVLMGGYAGTEGTTLRRWTKADGFDPDFAENAADLGTVIGIQRGVHQRTWVAEYGRVYPILDDGLPAPEFLAELSSGFVFNQNRLELSTLLVPLPDGGILLGGLGRPLRHNGQTIAGAAVRVASNGSIDSSFGIDRVNDSLTAMHLTADGQLLLGIPGAVVKTVSLADVLPQISSGPVSSNVMLAGEITLSVAASGPDLSYQWRRNGVDLAGATAASLHLSEVDLADVGRYTVVVRNGYGAVDSAPAILTVSSGESPVSSEQAVERGGYLPGGTVVVENTVEYTGSLDALRWQVLLPAGWSFRAENSVGAATVPTRGDTDLAEWKWTDVPASPFTFRYALAVPTTVGGMPEIATLVAAESQGGTTLGLAQPDPLMVDRLRIHSVDTNANSRIDLSELLRLIELYNARAGTTRTGRYRESASSDDGFAVDSDGAGGGTESLWRFHAADIDRNGRIDLSELLRVIELYNVRAGTVRTGRYHAGDGSGDGFQVGPDPVE